MPKAIDKTKIFNKKFFVLEKQKNCLKFYLKSSLKQNYNIIFFIPPRLTTNFFIILSNNEHNNLIPLSNQPNVIKTSNYVNIIQYTKQ